MDGIKFERCTLCVCLVGGADSSYVCMYMCNVMYVYTSIYATRHGERNAKGKKDGRTG